MRFSSANQRSIESSAILKRVSVCLSPDAATKEKATFSMRGIAHRGSKGVERKDGARGIKLSQAQLYDHQIGCLIVEGLKRPWKNGSGTKSGRAGMTTGRVEFGE